MNVVQHLSILMALLVLRGAEAPSRRVGAEGWSSLPPGTVVSRCAQGSKDQRDARHALERLRDRIDELTGAGDTAAALASLGNLLRLPCYRLAVEQAPIPWPTHALALKTWWQDGGATWLWSYVEPMPEGVSTDLRDVVVLPPDVRTVLFRETSSDPRLATLLCSQVDASCGAETGGWVERAREALSLRPEIRHWSDERKEESPAWAECEREAARQPEGEGYTAWRRCLGARRMPVRTLPLGRTRAPRDGWLMLSGRRGHYVFCDETRAYHLASGAAYVAQSCSGLALEEGGHVDFAKTDAARKPGVRAGRVLVDNLREAAWMLLLKGQAEDRNVGASTYPMPRGMPVRYRVGTDDDATVVGGGMVWSTSWTILHWVWTDESGNSRATGELTWPTSGDRAEAHAAALLDIAERSLVEGCPPAPLPSAPPLSAYLQGPDVNPLTGSRVEHDLWEQLLRYQSESDCGREPEPSRSHK